MLLRLRKEFFLLSSSSSNVFSGTPQRRHQSCTPLLNWAPHLLRVFFSCVVDVITDWMLLWVFSNPARSPLEWIALSPPPPPPHTHKRRKRKKILPLTSILTIPSFLVIRMISFSPMIHFDAFPLPHDYTCALCSRRPNKNTQFYIRKISKKSSKLS